MAAVTSYTKDKIDSILDGVIVSASIDSFGHLILTKMSGSTVDVGFVDGTGINAYLLQIAGLIPADDDMLQLVSGSWTNRTPSEVKTTLAISESDVSGLVTDLATINAAISGFTSTPLDSTSADILPSPGTRSAGSNTAAARADHVHGSPDFFSPNGLTGALVASRYVGATSSGAPVSGTFSTLDWVASATGKFYICTSGGSPGTWTEVGGISSSYLSDIAGLTPSANDMLTFISGHWANQTPSQVKSTLAIAESDVTNLVSDLAAIRQFPSLTPTNSDTLQYISGSWTNRTPSQVKSTLAIAESDVTNLSSDLSSINASIASIVAGSVALDTTATNIKSFGAQSAGSTALAAKSDHVHPDAGKVYAFSRGYYLT